MGRAATAALRRVTVGAVLGLAALVSSPHGQPSPTPRHWAFTLRAGPHRLRAVRAGGGPTVLLIHGYGESLLAWQAVFDRLARGAEVIAFDLPGAGLSSKPPSGYATDSLGRVVLQALDAMQIRRVVLVGHSLGGGVATAAATLAPERVRGLVLIAPAVVAEPWILRSGSAGTDGAESIRRAVARLAKLRTRFAGAHNPEWLGESDSALAYDPAADTAYASALQATLREFDFAYLTPPRAARLTMPVLVLWGEYDPTLPIRLGRRLADALPHSALEVVERSWHRPQLERPAEVAARIAAFVERLRADDPSPAP